MRKIIAILCFVLALFVCALGEESTDKAAAFKQKYEEDVAFKAIRTLSRYLSDDLTLDQSVMSFQKNTEAWEMLRYFDGGWFSSVKNRSMTDFRSENWEVISDTEFCCDVYMTLTINFSTNNKIVVFPCGYHFCFKQTSPQNNFWQVYDFYALPDKTDILKAAELSQLDEDINVYSVMGRTFKGFLVVLSDPSRITVGTIDYFGSSAEGQRVNVLAQKLGALVTINGGGFSDSGGKGNGGTPFGLIISNGVTKHGHESGNTLCNTVIGFDEENVLHVGKYSYSDMNALGLRDAMAFHPALIIGGEKVPVTEKRLYTIRTAIGQDADGNVLMLVVKGRQPDSLGASIEDLEEIMLDYGAVTAGNLDGGSSTCLYMNGDSVYSGYWPDCSRRIPAVFYVK